MLNGKSINTEFAKLLCAFLAQAVVASVFQFLSTQQITTDDLLHFPNLRKINGSCTF